MKSLDHLNRFRVEYDFGELKEGALPPDPFKLFQQWFQEISSATPNEPNAMILSTADSSGRPSSRTVLLKSYSSQGFVFFSNYLSRKGQELAKNPLATILFYWPELHRQVRVEGSVKRIPKGESDAYFATRPRDSQLGAWASLQSNVIQDRAALEAAFDAVSKRFANATVPRPEHWGGYCLSVDEFEFWQGRSNRMHDRIVYTRKGPNWARKRLSP